MPVSDAPSRDRSGALSFPVIAAGFALLLVLGAVVGLLLHRRYVGFERIVARHVPPDAALVLRWDVEKVTLFEPTRRFLLPLFDFDPRVAEPATAETRRARLERAGGPLIGRDLREVLVAFGPRSGDWALVLGGPFSTDDIVAVVGRVLGAEGVPFRPLGADTIAAPAGLAFGRASDGALVLASSVERLKATLPIRDTDAAVPRTGAGALVVHPSRPGLPDGAAELVQSLGDVTTVEGHAEWGEPLRVTLEVSFRSAVPVDERARLRRALETLLGAAELAALERRFAAFEVQSAGNQTLRAVLRLDDHALETAADRAGTTVLRRLGGQNAPN